MESPDQIIARSHLLSRFPQQSAARFVASGTILDREAGEKLFEVETRRPPVYFPLTAVVSLIRRFGNESAIEVGIIGREGMVGLSAVFGVEAESTDAVVQITGKVLQVDRDVLATEFRHDPQTQAELLRYTHALFAQVAQTAACNRLHTVTKRLARWLLYLHDRSDSSRFSLTQAFHSVMLGTRRAGIVESVAELEAAGLIRHERSLVTIVNRKGLEAAACECYEAVDQEFERAVGFSGRTLHARR